MSEILGTVVKYLLGILALVAIFFIAQRAFSGDRTSNAASQIATIANNMKQLYSGSGGPNYGSATPSVAISGGAVPSEMVSGTTIVLPWSGSTLGVAGSGTTLGLTANGVAAGDCAKLARTVQATNVIIGNGTAMSATTDAGTVAAACPSSGTTNITFNFVG